MRFREPKVVAFDLAGAETGFPPSLHAEALAIARRELLNLTIHASEPPDIELIDDALAQGAHRIGHGVRLATDILLTPNGQAILGQVARYVFDHRIHLEMAPTCHVQIGAVPTLGRASDRQAPAPRVQRRREHRQPADVGRVAERRACAAVTSVFDLSWAEIEQLVVNAVDAAFCPASCKQRD